MNTAIIILYSVGGVSSFVALTLTIALALLHRIYWTDPEALEHIYYILGYVPLQVLGGLLSIAVPRGTLYLEGLLSIYQSLAFNHFFSLLLFYFNRKGPEYFGINETFRLDEKERVNAAFIRKNVGEMFTRCRPEPCYFFFQYVVKPPSCLLIDLEEGVRQMIMTRAILALVMVVLDETSLFHYRGMDLNYGYLWMEGVKLLSTALAIYCTSTLLYIIKDVVWVYGARVKYGSLKFIVLFIPLQSFAFTLLHSWGCIPTFYFLPEWGPLRALESLYLTTLSIEMAFLALYHFWIFSIGEQGDTATIALDSDQSKEEEVI
jgi:hypothetical protein